MFQVTFAWVLTRYYFKSTAPYAVNGDVRFFDPSQVFYKACKNKNLNFTGCFMLECYSNVKKKGFFRTITHKGYKI